MQLHAGILFRREQTIVQQFVLGKVQILLTTKTKISSEFTITIRI